MKKILSCLSIINFCSFYISSANAENINGINYQNLDKIEITWYYHPSEIRVWDAPGGGILDPRFYWENSFSSYPELRNFFSNIGVIKSIYWNNISIGVLNNTPLIDDAEPNWDQYYDVDDLNKTGSWEFLLIPSKSFSWNIMKNPIFKEAYSIDSIPWMLQFSSKENNLRGNRIKIIWKFYNLRGLYSFKEEYPPWERKTLDMNLNIILVDDIRLDTKVVVPIIKEKTKEELIKEKVKVYEDKIDKTIDSIPFFLDKIDKINLFNKALSVPKYQNNVIVKELLDYLRNLENKLEDKGLTLDSLFN